MYEESWKHVGSSSATYKDDKEHEKTDLMFKLHHITTEAG